LINTVAANANSWRSRTDAYPKTQNKPPKPQKMHTITSFNVNKNKLELEATTARHSHNLYTKLKQFDNLAGGDPRNRNIKKSLIADADALIAEKPYNPSVALLL
jgi:hypothetical protein